MDILKARKKAQEAKEAKEAKEREAKEREAKEDATQAQEPEPKHKRGRASQPPRAAERDAVDDEEDDLEAARDRAIVGDDDAMQRRGGGTQGPRGAREVAPEQPPRLDPLHEFLAVYDEGDLVHVVDFGATSQVADDEKRFLSFDLAGEAYAASIMDIREILKFVALTEVPRAPREVLGVLSKRGVVMPVVDLGAILGLRPPDKRVNRDQRVLVAGAGERVCGLRVDRVHEVVRLAQRAIEDVPPSLGAKNAHMLIGLGRVSVSVSASAAAASAAGAARTRMLILLDVPAVLGHFSEAMGIAAAAGYGEAQNR